MDRRGFLSGVALGLAAAPLAAQTPLASKTRRVGYLVGGSALALRDDVVIEGLRERGHVEGKNLIIARRFAEGRPERLPELAAELVRSEVEVILTVGPGALQAARQATTMIPIVMGAGSSDPVGEGLAASLARPGGNITGLTYAVSPERFGKQLELLKSAAGRISRVAVLWDFDLEIYRRSWAWPLGEAAHTLGLTVQQPVQALHADDLPGAFALMKRQQSDAVLVAFGGALLDSRARIAELAIEHRLSTIAAFKAFVQAGGFMSYGPDFPDIYRRSTEYVDRILKGAKPGDLPIELPTKYELVINLKTAKALGITIPQSLLLRADEVIQ